MGEDTGGSSRERRPWRGDKRKRKGSGGKKSHTEWTQKAARKNDDPLRVTSGDGRRGQRRDPCSAHLAEEDADLVAVGVTSK